MGPSVDARPGAKNVTITQPVSEPTPPAQPADPGSVVPPAPPLDTPAVTPPAAPAGFVPLDAMLGERERRQKAEQRADALEAAQKPPVAPPTVASDPEGWQRNMEAQVARVENATRLEFSGRAAEQIHGKETLDAAMAWGKDIGAKDKFFGQRFNAQPDPFGFLVAEYRAAKKLEQIGSKSPEEWALEYAATQGFVKPDAGTPQQQPAGAAVVPPVTPQAPVVAATPSPSLARAPGAGAPSGPAIVADKDIVNGLWEKRT